MASGLQIKAGIAALALGAGLLASTSPAEAFFWSLFRGPVYVEAPPEFDYEDVIVVPRRERKRLRPFTRLREREHAHQVEDVEPPRRVSRGRLADRPAARVRTEARAVQRRLRNEAKAVHPQPESKQAAHPVPRPATPPKRAAELARHVRQGVAIQPVSTPHRSRSDASAAKLATLPQRSKAAPPAKDQRAGLEADANVKPQVLDQPASPDEGAARSAQQADPVRTEAAAPASPQMTEVAAPVSPQVAEAAAPVLPPADDVRPAASTSAAAPPPAIAEPPRPWADPAPREPLETGSNGAPVAKRIAATLLPEARPRADAGASGPGGARLASVEPQSPPSAPRTSRPDPERLSLYLVTQAEVRSLADLDGKPVALGAQEPALEKSIREAFASAHVTPNFVGDSGSDALGMVANGEAMAAPLRVAARGTPELTGIEKTLAATGLRLLQLPLDVPASPQGSPGPQP